jgi:hypothetical protein
MENAFEGLNFTYEQGVEALAEIEDKRARDGRICLCGHPNKRHVMVRERAVCNPAKQNCPCAEIRLVLVSSNTRLFLRKTFGGGEFHALGQGLVAAMESGVDIEWLIELKCDVCGEGGVSPVPINEDGKELEEPGKFNALVCRTCREKMQ